MENIISMSLLPSLIATMSISTITHAVQDIAPCPFIISGGEGNEPIDTFYFSSYMKQTHFLWLLYISVWGNAISEIDHNNDFMWKIKLLNTNN